LYTLHVISTLLFNKPAFKNVIVNGIVLAEDGKKMSKRLKNYPDPSVIFGNYGADALRLYLFNSPVVEADNIKFSELGVKEMLKVLLLPWYNSLSFLMECSNGDSVTEMDSWISASFNTFCFNLTTSVKNYKLNRVLELAVKFIDDLSNWYIRINRKALRNGSKLFIKLLKEFSILMAPFTPFFSEYCYQSLKNNSEPLSVHQCMHPSYNASSHPFNHVKKLIEGIRQMREKLKLKLKRPLKSVTVVCSSELRSLLKDYVDVIQNECNLLDLIFEDEGKYQYKISAKPLFDNLKKNPETMKEKIEIIRGLTYDQTLEILKNPVEINGLAISSSDLLISKEFVDLKNSNVYEDFGIIFDVEINDLIVELADAREFYSFLQKLRKGYGLTVSDNVCVSINNDYIKKVIKSKYADVVFGNNGELIGKSEYTYNGNAFDVDLYRVH
jgi:isoleucyl-tRNA synthetase